MKDFMVKKFKLWRRPKDLEMTASKEYRTPPVHADFEDTFRAGYQAAKQDIIFFLRQKQIGYGDAFFFKIADVEEIGEK